MKYLLDTNIVLHIVRNSSFWQDIEKTYFSQGLKNHAFASEVIEGEAWGIAIENRWGKTKRQKLRQTLRDLRPIPIAEAKIKWKYANISAYSHNRHKSLVLPKKFSARNMGKNDLWIAATAAALKLPLMTTDRDFEHLDGVFLDLILVEAAPISPPSHV